MAQQFEFLFIIPDGPNGAENRKGVTAAHEEFVGQTQEFWLAGGNSINYPWDRSQQTDTNSEGKKGPMFMEHSAGMPPHILGSWVLLQAPTKSEAVRLLQRDPFTTGKVWGWDKAQILCVRSGLRVPFVKESVQKALEKVQGLKES